MARKVIDFLRAHPLGAGLLVTGTGTAVLAVWSALGGPGRVFPGPALIALAALIQVLSGITFVRGAGSNPME